MSLGGAASAQQDEGPWQEDLNAFLEVRITDFTCLMGMIGDGHTWMPMHRMPFDGLPPGPGFSSLPIRFELLKATIGWSASIAVNTRTPTV